MVIYLSNEVIKLTRKIVLLILILVAGVFALVSDLFLDNRPAILMLLSLVTFHIISIIFYRESKVITTYHIFQTINLFGFFMLFIMGGAHFRLFGIISYFGSFLTMLVAFGAILQNRTYKLNERSFMWFSVFYFIFFSLYQPYILNLLKNFFGPSPIAIERTVNTFFDLRTVLIGANIVLQVLCMRNNELRLYFEKEDKKHPMPSHSVKDLPFFDKPS